MGDMGARQSNWTDAERLKAEQGLRCPDCDAKNTPGRTYVLIDKDGGAYCTACCKLFTVKPI